MGYKVHVFMSLLGFGIGTIWPTSICEVLYGE